VNLFSLAAKFPTEDAALLHLIRVRWPHGVRCVHCDRDECWLIESTGKTGKPRRLFQCALCRQQFSATSGTVFHDSHLPLTKWFAAIALMAEARKGMSAKQLQRHIGVTYKTAWYLCHRIREAMREDAGFTVGGPAITVEMDECFVGGKRRGKGHKTGYANKTVVIGLAERDGSIHMQSADGANLKSLRQTFAKVDPQTPAVVTDGKALYRGVIPRKQHVEGNHKEELKHKNWTQTQTVENAFSLFKRGIIGNYHWLSESHLDRYLGEFCWRYNRRTMQPWMFGMVLQNLAEREPLTYSKLTGRSAGKF
jgi:transposase-like protein